MKPLNSERKNNIRRSIFISYREKDTAGETGRLVDELQEYFSGDQIFMDIEKIQPGTDFTEAISHSLQSCDVFLAIIGPNWIGPREAGKSPRIFDLNDWVRLEIATALQRKIRIIPVLVDGGTMPQADQVPPDLHPLLNRQAYEISNRRWKYDAEQLIAFLINVAGIQPKKKMESGEQPQPARSWLARNAVWMLTLIVVSGAGIYLVAKEKPGKEPGETGHFQETRMQDSAYTTKDEATEQTNTNEKPATIRQGSVGGVWREQDEGAQSTFYLKQNGSKLTVDVEALGQKLSKGTGNIRGRDIELQFELFGNNVVLEARLLPDQQTMKGTYTFEVTGDAQPVVLKKVNQ